MTKPDNTGEVLSALMAMFTDNRKQPMTLDQILDHLEPAEHVANDGPEAVTQADMDKAHGFLSQAMTADDMDGLKDIAQWVQYWHHEPGLKASDHRHAYVHAVMEVLPLIGYIRFGFPKD